MVREQILAESTQVALNFTSSALATDLNEAIPTIDSAPTAPAFGSDLISQHYSYPVRFRSHPTSSQVLVQFQGKS